MLQNMCECKLFKMKSKIDSFCLQMKCLKERRHMQATFSFVIGNPLIPYPP